MQRAIQSFFVVQVALERAVTTLSDVGRELVRERVQTPVQRSLQGFVGASPADELEKVRLEIESIRVELRGLRTDLRELQQPSAVS